MDDTTIKRLNAINRRFYQITAENFDQSRSKPWPGWFQLLDLLSPPLTVLDVACGNGRFGKFLCEQIGPNLTYYGIDSNKDLLTSAKAALAGCQAYFEQQDVLESPPEVGEHDLVVLFGMLHHIPGAENRRTFLAKLSQRVTPGGLLVFSAWRFLDYERFRRRLVPWPDDFNVELGDCLLDWQRGPRALRYCHYVSDDEHAHLVKATGLTEIRTFRADGESGDMNRYSVLRRPQ